ncbi:MAG: magnesium chelatase [Saprospiraceae bacterium]
MDIKKIKTLGQLKKAGYTSLSVKEEMRKNLIKRLQSGKTVFEGIVGFDDTVIPDLERAILSRHNILLLGLRGQAKTRIARLMTQLLDEYMPIVEGSEINDDPLVPLSRHAIDKVKKMGDKTPISWVHHSDRFVEKLATPDVSVADLIGDIDPIKAASLKLNYSDERVIHFGLVPRANRSIFIINELPDLQPRIQVSLFNILQEGDLQIRGFKLRFPLDIQFVFTANPEDYTNRGSIVTPLKDRIESQILTHYPRTLSAAQKITTQEASLTGVQKETVIISDEVRILLELISFHARVSQFVDEKSGISARMSISALENLVSTAERRMLINNEKTTSVRITDFWGIIPALTGKMELVYEGEQEGSYNVALSLLSNAIKEKFDEHFISPNEAMKMEEKDPYGVIKAWFSGKNKTEFLVDDSNKTYQKKLNSVQGLRKLVQHKKVAKNEEPFFMELVLHGLAEYQVIGKTLIDSNMTFIDPLASMLDDMEEDGDLLNF